MNFPRFSRKCALLSSYLFVLYNDSYMKSNFEASTSSKTSETINIGGIDAQQLSTCIFMLVKFKDSRTSIEKHLQISCNKNVLNTFEVRKALICILSFEFSLYFLSGWYCWLVITFAIKITRVPLTTVFEESIAWILTVSNLKYRFKGQTSSPCKHLDLQHLEAIFV